MNEPKLTFLNFSNNQSNTVPSNKVKLNIDGKNLNRITLGPDQTEQIKNGYVHLRVGFNEFATECYFILCKKQSSDSLVLNAGKKHTYINSKYLVEQLILRMDLPAKNQLLNISENVSNSPDYITYRITKE